MNIFFKLRICTPIGLLFELDKNQQYCAYVPKNAMLDSLYEVKLADKIDKYKSNLVYTLKYFFWYNNIKKEMKVGLPWIYLKLSMIHRMMKMLQKCQHI